MLPEDAGGGPLSVLSRFRLDFHACLAARADELRAGGRERTGKTASSGNRHCLVPREVPSCCRHCPVVAGG
jgi:hypothetical protein